jgi:hypothetical protein
MFSCCFTRAKKNILKSEPKSEPKKESPPLTPEEIAKIKKNLDKLIDFADISYNYSQSAITEVYETLKAGNSPGDNRSLFAKLLSSSYELIGAVPVPGSEVISWFVGAVVDTYSNENPPGDVNLDQKYADMVARYSATSLALRSDLTDMHSNTNERRDQVYTVPFGNKQTITVRDLINVDVPSKDDIGFSDLLVAQRRGLKHSVCKEPFQEMRKWGVYYELKTSNPRGFLPARRGGNQGFIVHGNLNDWGKGQEIYSNQPLTYFHPEYVKVEIFGELDDPIANFKDGGKRFIQGFPAAVIMPQDQNFMYNGERQQAYRLYYVLTDYKSNLDFAVADGGFMNWLFIDDGFGNITNPDGVGYREEIVRQWMINGDGISDTITD